MDIFVTLKVTHRYLGLIDLDHPYGKLINAMHRDCVMFSTIFIGLTTVSFAILGAEQFADRGEAIVAANFVFGSCSMYILLQWDRLQIFALIASIKDIIDASA